MALPFYNDTEMRFDYDPQNNKFRFARRSIGPTAYTDIEEHDTVTPSDTNGIWVSASGNDSNNGTEAAPKKTILASINACTASRLYVWVDDSTAYLEDLSGYDNEFFSGIYATSGNSPSYLSLDATYISDYETIYDADEFLFVSADSGDDDTGDGSELTPYATIAKAVSETAVGKEKVCIIDSATYTEPGIEFTGNFQQLWAKPGETPTFEVTSLGSALASVVEKVAITTVNNQTSFGLHMAVFSDGGFLVTYTDNSDGQKGKFKIYDSDGNVDVAETIFHNAQASVIGVAMLSTNTCVIVFSDGADGANGKFCLYDQSGALIKATTEFKDGAIYTGSVAVDSNDNFIIVYEDGSENESGKFVIYDSSGTEVVSEVEFEENEVVSPQVVVFSDSSFAIIYRDVDSDATYFKKYESDGSEYISKKEVAPDVALCGVFSNDDIVICYSDSSNGDKGTFEILNSSGNTVVAATTFNNAATASSTPTVFSDDVFSICFMDDADSDKGKFVFYTQDGDEIYSETVFEDGATYSISAVSDSSDNLLIYYLDGGDSNKAKIVVYNDLYFDGILASTDAVIFGINLSPKYSRLRYMAYTDASEISINYCCISECENETPDIEPYAIYADDATSVYGCVFRENHQGIYVSDNDVLIYNTEFYWHTEGYALHINGAGADIEVEHCTFFSNYGGIRLENNDGDESVKNNIFHENSIYGIYADTAITYTYSINTDSNNGATAGSSVINANPLFVNEGEVDAEDLDLNLKIRVLGYPADSPAYLLADDTSPDRDAGARDTIPIGSETTWTSITVEKPKSGINVTQEPVGAVRLRKKDGTIATHYDAWSEEIDFRFDGLLSEDYESFMDMMTCGSNEVRWYPEPTTNQDDYNTYTLIYDECSGSAKVYKLNRTGIEGFRFKMARAYE